MANSAPLSRSAGPGPLSTSLVRAVRGVPHLGAEIPEFARLSDQIDAAVARFPWRPGEQLSALQNLQLCVHRSSARRVPEEAGEILDTDKPVAVRNRRADLETVLRASE